MKTVRSLIGVAMLVLAASFQAPGAQATVIFQYHSTCVTDCELIGLAAGDAVFGTIGVADDAVVGGGSVDLADIVSLDLHFGIFTFGLSTLAGFSGLLNATASAFDAFVFFALGSAEGYFVSHEEWAAGPAPTRAASGGEGTLTRSVPEPASLALLALGLLALGFMRRVRTPLRARRG